MINSGTCFRAPEPVLARWVSEHGIGWATGLEAEFAEAERELAVREVDPETMGRNGQLLREGAEALGVSHAPLRRNAGACVQCSSCPNGCRLDAKRAMHLTYLPRAVAAGARVRADVEVRQDRLRAPARGRRRGARRATPRGRDTTSRAYAVRARRAVLLAGGAFGTPELLLRSGFRSPSGKLGRNLRIHPAAWVGARFDEQVRGWDGVMQSYSVDEWERRGLLLEATFTPLAFGGQWLPGTGDEHQRRLLDFGHLASTGVHLSDRTAGRVGLARDGSLRISYRLTREDATRLVFGIARAAELHRAAGAREIYPQIAGHRDAGPDADRRPRGLPSTPQRPAPGGVPPDGHGADGRRPAPGRRRRGRVRARGRGPLRCRRQPAAELDRRQPDDHDRRDGGAGRAAARRVRLTTPPSRDGGGRRRSRTCA